MLVFQRVTQCEWRKSQVFRRFSSKNIWPIAHVHCRWVTLAMIPMVSPSYHPNFTICNNYWNIYIHIICIYYMYILIILYLSWGIPHFRKLAESMGWDSLGWSWMVANVVLTRGSWWHKLRKIRYLTQSGFHQHTSHSPAKIRGAWDFYFNWL